MTKKYLTPEQKQVEIKKLTSDEIQQKNYKIQAVMRQFSTQHPDFKAQFSAPKQAEIKKLNNEILASRLLKSIYRRYEKEIKLEKPVDHDKPKEELTIDQLIDKLIDKFGRRFVYHSSLDCIHKYKMLKSALIDLQKDIHDLNQQRIEEGSNKSFLNNLYRIFDNPKSETEESIDSLITMLNENDHSL